jgi:hypothetical protein
MHLATRPGTQEMDGVFVWFPRVTSTRNINIPHADTVDSTTESNNLSSSTTTKAQDAAALGVVQPCGPC